MPSHKKNHVSPKPIRGKNSLVTEDLITRFISHAQTVPNKIAILSTEQSFTYQQLYFEVVYWKKLLEQYKESRMVICLERSPYLLAALLAMQWLDITYIPVDASVPIERLRAIIEDSKSKGLLYDNRTHPHFKELSCLLLDTSTWMTPHPKQAQSIDPYTPKQSGVVYIIYTSGSTGKPKGVALSRKGLSNLLTSMSEHLLNGPEEILLAMSSISFDVSVLELYLPIWQQKTLYIANQAQYKDPFNLVEILNQHPITLISATPSMWNILLGLEWTGHTNLVATCGGEPLTPFLAQRILAKASVLWNLYGPTETTVWSSMKQIKLDAPITVGRPINNTEMRVMDENHKIVPPYVKGDLYIGGVGLAVEYINNADLTREKFIDCPDALLGRLYKTGDLACTTDDGEFIIFGRSDNQIKLHGYRIELEEIEAQMQTFPGIQESAICVHNEQLIAYLCSKNQSEFSESDFIQHLSQHLPEYMIPKQIIFLKQLPKSISGKIDRKALPAPAPAVVSASENQDHTQLTALQLILLHIWTEEFNLKEISIHDGFFELGGHSLIAARMIVKIAQKCGKKINYQDLYQAPTIEKLAKVIENSVSTEDSNITVSPNVTNTLPLEDFQLGFWFGRFIYRYYRRYNIVHRERIQGVINKVALDLALQLILQKQEVFSYHIHNLYPLQRLCTKPALRSKQWTEKSLTHLSDEETEHYLNEQFNKLYFQKTWRVNTSWISTDLYYLKQDQIELHICMPHLIADEQSGIVFFKELSQAYLFFTKQASLHAHHSLQSYKYYVVEQNALMHNHAEKNTSFWKNYLHDTGLFIFPKHHIVKPKNVEAMHFPLPESFATKLNQICVQHRLGLNDVLSAAVCLALLQCSNTHSLQPKKLLIGLLKNTRDNANYDDVIGLFVRMDYIKLNLSNALDLLTLAKEAQQSVFETNMHQRASGLLKYASLGQISQTKKPVRKCLVHLFCRAIIRAFQLDPSLISAGDALVTTRVQEQFLISINVLNTFLNPPADRAHKELLGLPKAKIPSYSLPFHIVNNRFQVYLHRNLDQNQPFISIATNLTPDFQRDFQNKLTNIIDMVD